MQTFPPPNPTPSLCDTSLKLHNNTKHIHLTISNNRPPSPSLTTKTDPLFPRQHCSLIVKVKSNNLFAVYFRIVWRDVHYNKWSLA